MVAEPWFLKPKTKHEIPNKIGILSFEVANVMSKTVHLYKSLTNPETHKLKNEILKSVGVRTLVSSDEMYLLDLAVSKILEDLNFIAGVVSRLGKKCSVQQLVGFEHVYSDIFSVVIDVSELSFLVKDMESTVRKMEQYVNSTASLYSEMEVLSELENARNKFQMSQHDESRKVFEQKVVWQKGDVKHLKDVLLWNQSWDKVVEMLARTMCTLYGRIRVVFGDNIARRDMFSNSSGSEASVNS